jgi:electron transfer flavoprotein beta subunit
LFRGADEVILLSDRKFAGADTLATSYVLCQAIKKVGAYDLVFCGRQAIDGDTAQVGPQTAEKLGVNQITCVDRIVELTERSITAERSIEGGYEIVKAKLPILLTITDEANTPRPPAVKKVLAYKYAMTPAALNDYDEEYLRTTEIEESHAIIKLWDHEEIGVATEQCGLAGSPTKVKQIESVVLDAGEFKQIENSACGLESLIQELMQEHIIG